MHRVVACAGGVAIVLVGLVGCGGDENAGAGERTPAPETPKLVIDGQDQNVNGPVKCSEGVRSSTSQSATPKAASPRP
jgi:lipoprotein LpqH